MPPDLRCIFPTLLDLDLSITSGNWFYMADLVLPIDRSTVFFYRFCTDLIAECLTTPITSILMSRNIWIPLLAAVAFQGLGAIMSLIIPETLPIAISEQASGASNMASYASDTDEEPIYDKRWKRWRQQTRESFGFITRDTAVAALVVTFLISKVGRQSINILLQYVSKRYGWSLSKASTCQSTFPPLWI